MYKRLGSTELKTAPELVRVIRAADSTYRRKTASVIVTDSVELQGTYWDGGTRSTYHAVRLADMRSAGAPQYDPPQFGGPKATPNCKIPEGFAIVETGYFCGKVAQAYVYVNEANVTKLLPSAPMTAVGED